MAILAGEMSNQGAVFASIVGCILIYAFFDLKNAQKVLSAAKSSSVTTKTISINGECRYGDDAYVIIVGAGVAGVALAHTLGKVGDANKDHACWERPEDMDTQRTVLKIDRNNPGSEVAAETAVALASASLVFRKSNPIYSKILLKRAIRVFAFSDKYRGSYGDGLKSYVAQELYLPILLFLFIRLVPGVKKYIDAGKQKV